MNYSCIILPSLSFSFLFPLSQHFASRFPPFSPFISFKYYCVQRNYAMDTNTTAPSTSVPTSRPIATVTAVFIILGVTAGAICLHLVLTFIFKRIAKKTIWQFDDDLVKHCKKPTFVMFPTVALLITIQLVTLPVGVYSALNHVLIIILIFAISYLVVMLIKCTSMAVSRSNSHLKGSEPKRAREVETQIIVMTRIVQGVVWMLGLAGIAMTFPNAWQVGVSLLASASVSALLLGFAAKSSIENALASLTIALTQPFLIEDQVCVNGEVGHIEEIQSQYVIVRTLDERRIVVPLTWFLANIFQNWSRNSPQQIAECKVYIDYSAYVPRVRQAFLKFARAHPLFDGRHCALLVTDCTAGTIELTCQISVANAMQVMQVTSDVREAMVEFIAKGPKQGFGTVTSTPIGGLGKGDGDGSCSLSLPPLTKEDEKMGGGSKMYQTNFCVSVRETFDSAEKPVSATTNARDMQSDHVQVNVDGSIFSGDGLTRRSVRDTDPSAHNSAAPMVAVSNASLSEK
ncbi:Mechanosensitive ion channel-domain-containing protein [Gamsiella multidivaricata]|uniref:Mechanosensitive ion channel-domain-containing protein n=1 Tax=Gamsiella multidivaricata TaxID=101098 RepID=UPI002220A0F4|nr:Mechanosensitive ion channel-domain-containing protein [Gamsiella multidivaricata]KAI7831539.1 Mechanosensitive ion channel-domain-containing protein [Gamsiella multidivaricata]